MRPLRKSVCALVTAAHLLAATAGLAAPTPAPGPATGPAPAPASSPAPQKVVVLELTDGAGLTEGLLDLLADEVRGAALALPAGRWVVLTRENIEQLLPPGTALADCVTDCEVALARRLGADVVVSGALTRFGPRQIQLTLRAHHAATAVLQAQITTEAAPDALDAAARQAARQLFRQVDPPAGAPAAAAARAPTTPGSGPPGPAAPTARVILKSDFEGAQLQVRASDRDAPRRVCTAPCVEVLARSDRYQIRTDPARADLAPTDWFSLPEGDEVTLYARSPDLALGGVSLGTLVVGAASLTGTATYLGIQHENDAEVDLGYALGGLLVGVASTALAIYLMGGQRVRVDAIGGSRGRPLGRPAP